MKYLYLLVIVFMLTGIGFFLGGSFGAKIGLGLGVLSVTISLIVWFHQWLGESVWETVEMVSGIIIFSSLIIWVGYDLYWGGKDEIISFLIILVVLVVIGFAINRIEKK